MTRVRVDSVSPGLRRLAIARAYLPDTTTDRVQITDAHRAVHATVTRCRCGAAPRLRTTLDMAGDYAVAVACECGRSGVSSTDAGSAVRSWEVLS